MSKDTDLTTIQILDNINKNKKLNNIDKITYSNKKELCKAGVKYNTIAKAYRAVLDKEEVYIVKNGTKFCAYSRCSKTIQKDHKTIQLNKDECFCHLHFRVKEHNPDELKIFEKDILPSSQNDKTKWLATITDNYFSNMGKRGAKKKNCENTYTFKNKNDPILLILNHKDASLYTKLLNYASQLLKNPNIEILKMDKKIVKKTDNDNNLSNNISELISIISSKKETSETSSISLLLNNKTFNNNILNKSENDESENDESESENDESESENDESENNESENDESENDESENDESKNDESKNDESKKDKYFSDKNNYDTDDLVNNENETNKDILINDFDNNDSDDGVSCLPIYTTKGKLLWYNEEDHKIYEPEGEDGGEEIGFLKEISKEYHTIVYENRKYTVLKEINITDKGDIYCCVLTDSLFDKHLNFIGTRTKIKNNDYRFDYI